MAEESVSDHSTAAPAPTNSVKQQRKSVAKPATVADPGVSLLPISRVHKIIKADREVRLCSKEAIFLISKATEFMLGKLTNAAYHNARLQKRPRTVKYSDMSSAVSQRSEWFYLQEVVPPTIPLAKALALRAETDPSGAMDIADANHPSRLASQPSGGHVGPIKKQRKKSGLSSAPALETTTPKGASHRDGVTGTALGSRKEMAAAAVNALRRREPSPEQTGPDSTIDPAESMNGSPRDSMDIDENEGEAQ